jgi:hypothetical protein
MLIWGKIRFLLQKISFNEAPESLLLLLGNVEVIHEKNLD